MNNTSFVQASSSLDADLLKTNSVLLLFGIAAFLGNGLIVAVVVQYPSLRKKADAIHLICYLAITDGICGLGSIITGVDRLRLQLTNAPFNRAMCLGNNAVLTVGLMSSQMMIAWVALDRLTAVSHPIEYRAKKHAKLALRYFIFTVAYAPISTACLFVEGDLTAIPAVCNVGASMGMVVRIYFVLFSFIVSLAVVVLYTAVQITLWRKMGSVGTSRSALATQLQRQAKVTKVITLVLVMYILLWMAPQTIFYTAGMIGMSGSVLGVLGPLVAMGAVISAASNIFIYSAKMEEFRIYFKKFVKHQHDNTIAPTSGLAIQMSTHTAGKFRPNTGQAEQQL